MKEVEFLKMVASMGEIDLDGFTYELNGKKYGFEKISAEDGWDDQGKYQYKTERGQLVELDKSSTILKELNYGVSREVQRSGSYFTDYNYDYDEYKAFEITEVFIPEVIIPAHIEKKDVYLTISNDIVNEIAKEKEKELNAKNLRKLEEDEEKARQEELRKKYVMNDPSLIQRVSCILKKRGVGFTIKDMQQEYFNIVEKEGLKDEEWLNYHRKNTLNK